MKRISIFMLVVIMMFSAPIYTMAETMTRENDELEEVNTYDPEAVDWENIDEIIVFYYSGNDQFIADAIERGIKVTFEEGAMRAKRYTHFNSLSWISRDGVISLSMDPKQPFLIDKDAAWAEAWLYFEHHPIYTGINNPSKFDSMYNQYVCHVDFAGGFKTPWNIEPAKPDKGYLGFVTDLCN